MSHPLFRPLFPDTPTLWIITEGLAGTENQCIGIADAMGIVPVIKRIGLRQPWKLLSPYLGLECAATFTEPIDPPYPDILITSGRKSIAASRYIKRKSGGKTFTVHVQDPRISPQSFDRVIVPRHDPTRGDNVFVTVATPNKITPERLAAARDEFAPLFSVLPSPRIAVLIGGSTKNHRITGDEAAALARTLSALGPGLMMTTSRRTGDDNTALLRNALSTPGNFFWDGTGANPYFGMLAHADAVIVTADSTSMISEAATTGKPVYVLPMPGLSKRQSLLVENLKTVGAVKDFDGTIAPWAYSPLTDAQDAAKIIADDYTRSRP